MPSPRPKPLNNTDSIVPHRWPQSASKRMCPCSNAATWTKMTKNTYKSIKSNLIKYILLLQFVSYAFFRRWKCLANKKAAAIKPAQKRYHERRHGRQATRGTRWQRQIRDQSEISVKHSVSHFFSKPANPCKPCKLTIHHGNPACGTYFVPSALVPALRSSSFDSNGQVSPSGHSEQIAGVDRS